MQVGEKYRINFVRKTAMLTAIVTLSGSSIMYIFAQQAIELSYIAGLVSALTLVLFLYIQFNPYNKQNGLILMLGIMLAVLLPTTFSGGVNSRFSVLIAILPIMMCLILNRRIAIILTVIILTYLCGITLFNEYIPDYTNFARIDQEQFAKTLWLTLATCLGLSFGLAFVDVNSKLTFQLESSESNNSELGLYTKESILTYAQNILLKLAKNKDSLQHLCLAIVDVKRIDDVNKKDLVIVKSEVRKQIKRVIRQDFDVVGYFDNNQLLVCMQAKDKSQFTARCQKIAAVIQKSNHNVIAHIGFIAVGSDVSVDVSSLTSVAQIALRKSYNENEHNIINYDDMRRA